MYQNVVWVCLIFFVQFLKTTVQVEYTGRLGIYFSVHVASFIELTYRTFLPSPNIHKFKEEKFLRRSHAILENIFAATWNSPKEENHQFTNIHFHTSPILSFSTAT